jgi:multicomponent Na+:H+ antiporter subunit D
MTLESLVPLVVLVPLLAAAGVLALGRRLRAQRLVTVIALTLTLGISVALLIGVDAAGTLVVDVGGWQAPFGIVLVVDRLAALLLVVSSVVLLAVLLFSVGQGLAYGDDETPVTIYNPAYLILAAGVFTAFIAGDLFNLYVGFEILLVASYVLITLGGTEARIRTGTTYIVVSLVSSFLFLASIAMIYGALGTVNLAHIAVRMAEIPAETQTLLHVMLLIGFGIKAAVFPLSFWLPDSYPTAPAPVTAVFAGLLTKVGVYAIIRTETLLFPSPELNPALLIVAILTMVVGILGAVAQTDIKRLLSFTLVSHIGFLILGIGLGTIDGTAATIYYVAHHIVVQTALFLAAGLIEQVGGSTSIPRLGGLLAPAPSVGVLYLVAALNLGGIPPFSGFLGKLGLFQASIATGDPLAFVAVGAGALVSLLTLYALMRVWSRVFWGTPPAPADEESTDAVEPTHDDAYPATGAVAIAERARAIPRLMTTATVGLVLAGIALTVFAGPLYQYAERAALVLGENGYVTAVFPEGTPEVLDD